MSTQLIQSEPQSPQQQYKFKISPTTLDAFAWYLKSEDDAALQNLIDKINRVPFTPTEAMERGTVFNELVDIVKEVGVQGLIDSVEIAAIFAEAAKDDRDLPKDVEEEKTVVAREWVRYNKNWYRRDVLEQISNRFTGSLEQVYVEAPLETKYGQVMLYGYVDEIHQYTASDIKTTAKYEFPKYNHNWQHQVYLYCLNHYGGQIDMFDYVVMDPNGVYVETYVWDKDGYTGDIRNFCEQFIRFLEEHREQITDKKIFGGFKDGEV